MKSKKTVSFFPVSVSEQALLLRVREPDLAGRVSELVDMLDQIAEAKLTQADLEQAIQAFLVNSQGEGLEARFDNLDGRLKERIAKGLAEVEGRLSKRLDGGMETVPEESPVPTGEQPEKPPVVGGASSVDNDGVPKEASVAFRIGPDLIWGASASKFYGEVWRYLFQKGCASTSDLPIPSGKKRYVVANEPIHPTGKEFTRTSEPVPGVFIEVNLARGDIIRRSKKFLKHYGVAFEVVVGDEG